MKDKKNKELWNEDWDLEFEEEYGVIAEPEAEDTQEKPTTKMLLVFGGLIVVAAVLSAVLWVLTHQKEDTMVLPTDTTSSVVDYIDPADLTSSDEDADDEASVGRTNPNVVVTSDGREVVFSECDNLVTPKEYVNLRTEPSTGGGESTVYCQVYAGDVLHRTGYSPDFGWSRVEYDEQILYVVSTNVEVVEQ